MSAARATLTDHLLPQTARLASNVHILPQLIALTVTLNSSASSVSASPVQLSVLPFVQRHPWPLRTPLSTEGERAVKRWLCRRPLRTVGVVGADATREPVSVQYFSRAHETHSW